jgi:SpoVK/Ycf46/Vps4 family AAA+-type ATPase
MNKADDYEEIAPAQLNAEMRSCVDSAERYFASSLDHLFAEVQRVHLLVAAAVKRARQLHKVEEQFQGLVISEAQVDELLKQPAGTPHFAADQSRHLSTVSANQATRTQIAAFKAESLRRDIPLRLVRLEQLFSLSSFDVDCLLICLAPELDLRYERLYAYLQDDVTKKRPTVDLVSSLLSASLSERVRQWQAFLPGAPLPDYRIVNIVDEPTADPTTLLTKSLQIDRRIASYLFGSDEPDAQLRPYIQCLKPAARMEDLVLPSEMKRRLSVLSKSRDARAAILYFHGPSGTGRMSAAEALCRELEIGLLVVDGESLPSIPSPTFQTAVRSVIREASLRGDAIYWDGFEVLLADDKKALRKTLLSELSRSQNLTFVAGTTTWEPTDELQGGGAFVRVEFLRPTYADRLRLWQAALSHSSLGAEIDLPALSNKFRFTGGQIRNAVKTARGLAYWRNPGAGEVTQTELYEACRLHSSRRLSTVGRKIKPHHLWEDIVLPYDRMRQLQEICDSMKYRSLVFDQWGFDRKLSLGKGLNILFVGPSGTGKTMAAEIMAAELGLDLYKIDLSTVVSKYIGETEKNLARIFMEAETSNAILFFDEADALFGKRSEVRDSHDRYANIEINYLLQKMEEHEGVVILATNFRRNMDEAFVRRMHFTVEFPFPSEADRRQIWEKIWPEETPQNPDLDLDFMARRFEIAGGNIRNVAVAAAFLAASDGGSVSMTHLLHGVRREYQKMGKVVMEGEFTADLDA